MLYAYFVRMIQGFSDSQKLRKKTERINKVISIIVFQRKYPKLILKGFVVNID